MHLALACCMRVTCVSCLARTGLSERMHVNCLCGCVRVFVCVVDKRGDLRIYRESFLLAMDEQRLAQRRSLPRKQQQQPTPQQLPPQPEWRRAGQSGRLTQRATRPSTPLAAAAETGSAAPQSQHHIKLSGSLTTKRDQHNQEVEVSSVWDKVVRK